MKDKSKILPSLKDLDEGSLRFPRAEMLEFLRAVDAEVRGFANDLNMKKYGKKIVEVCQTSVTCNETLENDFVTLASLLVE